MGINCFFINGFQEQNVFGDHTCVISKLQKLRQSEDQEFKDSLAI